MGSRQTLVRAMTTRRRRIVRWILLIVTIAVPIVVLILQSREPPFKFIRPYRGQEIKSPFQYVVVGGPYKVVWFKTLCYGFPSDFDSIRAPLDRELRGDGWRGIGTATYTKGGAMAELYPRRPENYAMPKEVQCYLTVRLGPSWLERQWIGLKRRFRL